ncbi:hypothetical protein PHYBOEH_008915 [Phytophthora boehmeriae]|uniref:RxLR effector protein n=1 Tax=Phytophthora boehmeriae TaxID=109152 RepID=A0A8T1X1F1_9STRA|nr:hypothetical protein PHYBOEH_008915 [Phytophthora boehmeriae]
MRLDHFVVAATAALLATNANPVFAGNVGETHAATTHAKSFSFDYGDQDDRSTGLSAEKEERLTGVTAAAAAGGRSNGDANRSTTTSDEPGFWDKVTSWWKRTFGNQAENSSTSTRRLRLKLPVA